MVSSKLDRELAQQIILKAQVNDTASVKEKVPQIDTGKRKRQTEGEWGKGGEPKNPCYCGAIQI